MAVENTAAFSGPFYPNGVTTSFPFEFAALGAAEVALLDAAGQPVTGLSYEVELSASGEGGVVVFTSPPDAAALPSMYIVSEPTFQQDAVYGSVGVFNPRSLNAPVDRSAIRDIWLKDRTDRSIVAPVGGTGLQLAPDSNGLLVVQDGSIFLDESASGPFVDFGTNAHSTAGEVDFGEDDQPEPADPDFVDLGD